MQAYRFALDPSPAQARDLQRHAGAARYAFNWALAAVKANIGQRVAERSYGVADQDLTPAVGWNLPALRRAWNQAKPAAAPWWPQCSKEAFNTGLDAMARALRNWADSKSGKRQGKRVGFPRFKSKRNTTPSTRFTTGVIRVEADRHHVTLPRLGTIKTHESTRKLARRLEAGTARILSATVRYQAGRWFCSFTVEVTRPQRRPARPYEVIGVDLGVKSLAVLSNGHVIDNPRHLVAGLRRLRRLSRRAARQIGPHDTKANVRRTASKNWADTRRALGRAHARVSNLRRDSLHKLTTTLAATYGTIVIEDLNVAGMAKNRLLARAIHDAGFGEIRRQLDYKTRWHGGTLIVASRWFPSSKTCSDCGATKPKLRLSERVYTCENCGLVLDRDLNAARNLAALAAQHNVAGSGPETSNARRANQKTPSVGQVALKREPGTATADQTGTVHAQARTASHGISQD
ncbi:IS607 family element RNA-guided endonuclease TnpB [Catelliglobosispora koreensis]|uniref:IS607 family element RNA-guided endonuclease TnpB n=1 Tax=Catelliglobosispora koreensis TaxID=129052 RepID=UPI001B7FDFD7|nr:IS607 family element RNA-guided endonuclease TnpB [Catelliglobosispora koreensis]